MAQSIHYRHPNSLPDALASTKVLVSIFPLDHAEKNIQTSPASKLNRRTGL